MDDSSFDDHHGGTKTKLAAPVDRAPRPGELRTPKSG